MTELTSEDILKLARLSRLALSADEAERYRSQLSVILDYVDMLSAVDVEGIEPTYQLSGQVNQMRDDTILTEGPYTATPAELMSNAPAIEAGQFKVKRVIT